MLSALVSVASSQAPCPNAPFRTGASASLPDCRAYELVSPIFENGAIPLTEGAILDSSHLLFSSLGGFGDTGANPNVNGASYIAERTATSWTSTPLDPPAGKLFNTSTSNSSILDLSGDFSKALFVEDTVSPSPASVDHRLYLREPYGSFVQVGPTESPAIVNSLPTATKPIFGYVGASQDFSHVLFDVVENGRVGTECKPACGGTRYYWPGDTTVADGAGPTPSLYEWIGSGHTGEGSDVPSLVGVDNAGRLISQCGTVLGSGGNGSSYNAVSPSGSIVLFTARAMNEFCEGSGATVGPPADELFARVNESQTVSISEPSAADCAICNTSAPGNAIFEGASHDTTKIFFLTEQELLPGQTGTNLYEYDFNGPVASSQHPNGKISLISTASTNPEIQGVVRIAEDGSRVYFVADAVLTTHPNDLGREAQAEAPNLYVYDATSKQVAFVAVLSPSDEGVWETRDLARSAAATPDGRFLLFHSRNDLTTDASGEGDQIYRYDAELTSLTRISIGQNGFNNNGNSADFSFFLSPLYFPDEATSLVFPHSVATQGVSVSDDGSYVFFVSPAALTPRASNDPNDEIFNVYEWHEGQVYLLSDGQDRHHAFGEGAVNLIGSSPSGSDVYFTTADALVSQDGDGQKDIYDARISGGFPGPSSSPACAGDACQGALSISPSSQVPSSAMLSGLGNQSSPPVKAVVSKKRARKPVRCSTGKRLAHKCVNKKGHSKTVKAKSHKGGK
jgi:hypothetical protein